jgi:2-desacetyl-2-hydroxyethyl bacteriochlorophyllide A dehydrogenase
MKAAIWTEEGHVEVREADEPVPQSDEVVLRVSGCGVCGTDYHIFCGHVPLAKPPVTLGHEIFGTVHRLGKSVSDLRVGQAVCLDPVVTCGRCKFCQAGRPNLCDHPTILGYVLPGGFAQFTKAPRSHIYPVDEAVGIKGGILVETLACVLHGYERLQLEAGSTVLILGAGCVGLLWTQVIRQSLSARIIQTELLDMRLITARKLGADVVIDPQKTPLENEVRQLATDGVDCIIDATGSAQAIQESLGLLKKGGTLMIFGVCPETEQLSFSPFDIFNKELTILGSKMPPYTLGKAARMIESGTIDSSRLVTHVLPLAEISEALRMFEEEKSHAIKIAIDPWQ